MPNGCIGAMGCIGAIGWIACGVYMGCIGGDGVYVGADGVKNVVSPIL